MVLRFFFLWHVHEYTEEKKCEREKCSTKKKKKKKKKSKNNNNIKKNNKNVYTRVDITCNFESNDCISDSNTSKHNWSGALISSIINRVKQLHQKQKLSTILP